jgi:hypothetical protein
VTQHDDLLFLCREAVLDLCPAFFKFEAFERGAARIVTRRAEFFRLFSGVQASLFGFCHIAFAMQHFEPGCRTMTCFARYAFFFLE